MSEHDDACDCWLCQGDVPDDLVERIKNAKPEGKPMNADEFSEWLKSAGDDPLRPKQPPC